MSKALLATLITLLALNIVDLAVMLLREDPCYGRFGLCVRDWLHLVKGLSAAVMLVSYFSASSKRVTAAASAAAVLTHLISVIINAFTT